MNDDSGAAPAAGPSPERSVKPVPTTDLTHLDERGRVVMVDVGGKPVTNRNATATGCLVMAAETARLVAAGQLPKGDVVATARIAGIQAAKRTADLIPLCHPLPLTHVGIEVAFDHDYRHPEVTQPAEGRAPAGGEARLTVTATVRTSAQTGVEMEALTAVSVALLTLYDMTKAVDKHMRLEGIQVVEKRGGRSDWAAGVS